MPNMSFALTTQQFKARTKTVTRRARWLRAKPGDIVDGVEKCMGLPKGAKIVRLGKIRFKSVRREPVNAITQDDVIKEGFPDWTPKQFIELYCAANKCAPSDLCTRIEFEYLEDDHVG